jgi:hypothetical protein
MKAHGACVCLNEILGNANSSVVISGYFEIEGSSEGEGQIRGDGKLLDFSVFLLLVIMTCTPCLCLCQNLSDCTLKVYVGDYMLIASQ